MVATYSYLPRALVGVESFLRHNGDCDALILVADLSRGAIQSQSWELPEGVRLVGVDEISDTRIQQMHRYYDAFEFCCAAKAFFVEYAISHLGYRKVMLLDPDTVSFAPYDDIWQTLDQVDVALSPHSNTPMPEDGRLPNDWELATSGFANAGFWAMRQTQAGLATLRWLERRLVHYGFFEPRIGLYADQLWLSCLPWYFPEQVAVLRHPGLNVAYWNLHERELSTRDGRYYSNDRPLMMLHLSGYNEENPDRLTRHPSRPLSDANADILSGILASYQRALTDWRQGIPKAALDRPCTDLPFRARLKCYREVHGGPPLFADSLRRLGLGEEIRAFAVSLTRRLRRPAAK